MNKSYVYIEKTDYNGCKYLDVEFDYFHNVLGKIIGKIK